MPAISIRLLDYPVAVTIINGLTRFYFALFPGFCGLHDSMNLNAAKRFPARRSFVLLALLCTASLGGSGSALASCGDYLLHGPDANQSLHLQIEEPVDALARLLGSTIPPSPSRPGSACEGGRCHSAPLAPPADPPRITAPKQVASVVGMGELPSHLDAASWARPINGVLPQTPFLEIPSPPPRHS